jgi:hypothetical protein
LIEEVPRSIPNNNMANKILSFPTFHPPTRRSICSTSPSILQAQSSNQPVHPTQPPIRLHPNFHPSSQPVHPAHPPEQSSNLPGSGNKYRIFFEIATDCIFIFKFVIFTH